MKLASALLASLALSATAFAAPAEYFVYTYSATVNSAVTVGDATFAAGDAVSGQIYVHTGVANTTGWAYPGETGVYVDAVESFSFAHEDVSIVGSGGGNLNISNNRRLIASGGAYADGFDAYLGTEAGNSFTEIGGADVTSMQLNLSTNFEAPGSPNLNAITGVGYPAALTPSLFNLSRALTISFDGGASVTATIQSVSVSYASAVPEPSSFAALAGLGALGLVALRRRRSA